MRKEPSMPGKHLQKCRRYNDEHIRTYRKTCINKKLMK